jgi:hypothetical protein
MMTSANILQMGWMARSGHVTLEGILLCSSGAEMREVIILHFGEDHKMITTQVLVRNK